MRQFMSWKILFLATASSSMALAAPPDAGSTMGSLPAAPKPADMATQPQPPSRDHDHQTADASTKVRVEAISITGNTLFKDAELRPLVRGYVGKTVTSADLRAAAMSVQNYYRDHGYFLTNAQVVPKTDSPGRVEIRVVEWVLGSKQILVAADAPLQPSLAQAYFSNVDPGNPLEQSALERAILNLRNVPATKVHTAIRPGTSLGKADAHITVSRSKPVFGGSLRVDNWGNRNTGRARGILDLQSRGLFGLGEVIDLTGVLAQSHNTEFGRLSVQAPVGSQGTSVGVSYSELNYGVGRDFKPLRADGLGDSISASVAHPLYLTRHASLYLGAGVENKHGNDRQQGKTVEQERSVDNASVSLSGHYQGADADGVYHGFEATLTRGDNEIKTLSSMLADQAPGGLRTAGKFTKISGKYLISKPIRGKGYLVVSLRGQTANRNLDPLERTSLGGPMGVRAFPVSVGFGDQVLLSTVEYRHFLPAFSPMGGSLYWNNFWDYGYVKINRYNYPGMPDNNMKLSGIGTGLSLDKADDYSLKVDMAGRLGGDHYRDDDSRDIRVWMSGTKFF